FSGEGATARGLPGGPTSCNIRRPCSRIGKSRGARRQKTRATATPSRSAVVGHRATRPRTAPQTKGAGGAAAKPRGAAAGWNLFDEAWARKSVGAQAGEAGGAARSGLLKRRAAVPKGLEASEAGPCSRAAQQRRELLDPEAAELLRLREEGRVRYDVGVHEAAVRDMDTCGMMFGKTIWTSLITWALSPSLGNVVGAVGAGTLVTMSECFENVSPMAFRFKKLGATAFTRSMKDDRPAMYGRDLRASVARMTPFTRRARSDSWTGSARLAYRCLLLTEPAMSLGSTGRGSPISISVLHSRGPAASPFSLSSSFTSAPKRRRAPVSAAMSTSFTEQPCLLRICCTSDISTLPSGNHRREPSEGAPAVELQVRRALREWAG
ncbi:unnamed protein product, partial [Prorocentrum cordatum]